MFLSGCPPCAMSTHWLLFTPVVEDNSPQGLSAARPTSTSWAGLFTHSAGPRRQASPVRGCQGCWGDSSWQHSSSQAKTGRASFGWVLFTWATLQPSVSASGSAQISSVFQNSCCLTDCRYLSFILALYLLALDVGSAFQASYNENQASCHEAGFPTADQSPSFYLLPGTHEHFPRRSLPHWGISKPWYVVNHFTRSWTGATSGLSCANLLPVHRNAWSGMSTVFHPAETVGGRIRQERGYSWKLSWNLTVTIVLTSLIQCYGKLNDSQLWKLKSVNGKNPVAQDHNPGFSPVLPEYLLNTCSLPFVQDGKLPGTE